MKSLTCKAQPGTQVLRFSRDRRRAFVEDGYVILRNVIPDEHVRAARQFINQSLGQGNTFDPKETADGRVLGHLQNKVEIPAISRVFNHTDILPLAESLLGSVDLVRSELVQVALRFPQMVKQVNSMHVDGEFTAHEIRSFSMLVVIFLSDCLDSNKGNFTVQPGSHRKMGRLFVEGGDALRMKMHGAPGNLASTIVGLAADGAVSLQPVKQIKAAAGDAVLLHGLLAHGAAPNLGPDIRYALVARFVPHGLDLDDFDANWRRLVDMWGEWPGLADILSPAPSGQHQGAGNPSDEATRIIHVTSPHNGSPDVTRRTRLFYQSVAEADKSGVTLLAVSSDETPVPGWHTAALQRDARVIGDSSTKPFIKDLFDIALEHADPHDWLFLSNCDCPIAADLYHDLREMRGTVVEYMRRNVSAADSTNLEQLLKSCSWLQENGIDGLAIRAGYYRQLRGNLPDLLVGAPHWDTLYSGILRRLIPVRVNTDKLFHPEHEPTWNMATPASQYNSEIYEEALKYGDLARETIYAEPDATDTAVVLVSFGDDAGRAKAHVTALKEQLKQDLYCDFFVVELLMDGRDSIYPAQLLANVQHLVLRGTDANKDLFQKEPMMNIGWQQALSHHGYEFFIFVDADVYCRDRGWLRYIRERLLEDPRRLVQGFQLVEDSEDPRYKYSALLAADVLGFQTDLGRNPGLCWGMHREVLEQGGGFNPFYIDGWGDSGFVAEYIEQSGYVCDRGSSTHRWTEQIRRELDVTVVPDCVPVNVVHVHHGSFAGRNYDNIHYAVGAFDKPLKQLVFLNESGLLEWHDPACRERRILREREHMATPEAIEEIFRKHEYGPKAERLASVDRRRIAGSRSYGSGYQAILERWESAQDQTGGSRRGLYVFNPSRIFRKHFPYSWCCHIRNSNADNRIPMNGAAAPPELVLDAEDDCEWFAAALPLTQSWSPVDVSEYERLTIAVAVSRSETARLSIRLVSISGNEMEHQSAEVSLEPLKLGVVQTFETPITAFANEVLDLKRIRIIEILGHGNFCARLNRIVFE